MPIEVQMPKLGLTMEAGTILDWLVDDGTEVVEGLPVLLIETDKVESEVESSGSGRLHQAGVMGESYPCGAVIGWFLAGHHSGSPRVRKGCDPHRINFKGRCGE